MKYFSVGVNGEYNFSNADGYDPVTGDKLKQVDKNTVVKYLKEKTPSETVEETKVVKEVESVNVNIDKQTLIGLEKNARFYPVEFKNVTERNFILCISATADVNKLIIVQKIDVGQSVKLSLMEGQHFFSYIDNNGKCYGERGTSEFFKRTILTRSENTLNVSIDNQAYYLEKTFSLNVLASDNQIITLKEDNVSHNGEVSDGQGIVIVIAAIFFICIIAVCLLYIDDKISHNK